ncbi:MAG: hypothetical protein M1308_23935 [Actinobacteria bacterium]|nr:hypothetical protein [Actinomycetota bacterium]
MEEVKPAYGKRKIGQWILIYAVIGIIIYAGVYFFILNKNKVYSSSPQSNPSQNSITGQKFQDSNIYQYSYKIFPGSLTPKAQQALSGFNMQTKVLSDGSTQVDLIAIEQNYKNQSYIVKPGNSLYFIEKNMSDDSPENNTDKTTADDSAVIVDPQGFIVQS